MPRHVDGALADGHRPRAGRANGRQHASHRGTRADTDADTEAPPPLTVTDWSRRADRACHAYDGRLAAIRADATLSDADTVTRVAATYAHLVTTLQTLEQDWIRTLPASVGTATVERARRPFVPRPVPDEVW